MRRGSWRRILATIAVCMILVGIYPLARCLWLSYEPRPAPLVMQFALRKGEYTSSPLKSGFHGPSRIDLEWQKPIPQSWLDLGWKIVDSNGSTVRQGSLHYWVAGKSATVYGWPEGFRRGQSIVVTVPSDVPSVDEPTQLKISVDEDEIGLDMSYGYGIAIVWAGVFAGPALAILLALLIRQVARRTASKKLPELGK
jgi:hypothetical protein